jgi:hypothetical protein
MERKSNYILAMEHFVYFHSTKPSSGILKRLLWHLFSFSIILYNEFLYFVFVTFNKQKNMRHIMKDFKGL